MQTALFTKEAAAAAGFHKIRGVAAPKATVGGLGLESRSRISFDRKATFGGTKLIARCSNNNNNTAGDDGDQAGGVVQKDIEAEVQLLGLFSLVKYRGQFEAKEDKVSFRVLGLPAFTYFVKKDASNNSWFEIKVCWTLFIGVWALLKMLN